MIKSITIANPIGETLTLELGYPEKSGFLILGIDGLGPSKATINTIEMATSDGSRQTSAKITSRSPRPSSLSSNTRFTIWVNAS